MKLNEKIYYYRKRAKLSQEELAAQVGVSRQAVSKWELGDATPELDKLAALAKAFGVTADELLSEGEPEADGEKREERQTQEFSYQKERGRAAWKEWPTATAGWRGYMWRCPAWGRRWWAYWPDLPFPGCLP